MSSQEEEYDLSGRRIRDVAPCSAEAEKRGKEGKRMHKETRNSDGPNARGMIVLSVKWFWELGRGSVLTQLQFSVGIETEGRD